MTNQTHTNPTDESIDTCELTQSERNRYFHGKLMTARDMAAEQIYHRGLFTRRSRHVTGYGVVEGLEARVARDDDAIEVTIDPGYAIDCCGRPVVVPRETTARIEGIPSGGHLGLFIEYAECVTETVPIPGSEDACERECAYNRVIETFEVVVRALDGEPEPVKPVPGVTFPDLEASSGEAGETSTEVAAEFRVRRRDLEAELERLSERGHEAEVHELEAEIERLEERHGLRTSSSGDENGDKDAELGAIARDWGSEENTPIGCADNDTEAVYLGWFSSPSDEPSDVDTSFRPRVYTNDMLYSAIAQHTVDFTNPHQVTPAQIGALVSVSGVEGDAGQNVDLAAADEHVDITPDPDENEVGVSVPGLTDHLEDTDNPHEVTTGQIGALSSLSGVEGDDEDNVDLEADDEHVSINPATNANAVGISVPGLTAHLDDTGNPHDVVASLNELDGDLELASSDDSVTITTDDGRIDLSARGGGLPHVHALVEAMNVFGEVAASFESEAAHELETVFRRAIREVEIVRSPEAYLAFMAGEMDIDILGLHEAVAEQLGRHVGGRERFAEQVETLSAAVQSEDPDMTVLWQLVVCGAARRFTGTTVDITRFFPNHDPARPLTIDSVVFDAPEGFSLVDKNRMRLMAEEAEIEELERMVDLEEIELNEERRLELADETDEVEAELHEAVRLESGRDAFFGPSIEDFGDRLGDMAEFIEQPEQPTPRAYLLFNELWVDLPETDYVEGDVVSMKSTIRIDAFDRDDQLLEQAELQIGERTFSIAAEGIDRLLLYAEPGAGELAALRFR